VDKVPTQWAALVSNAVRHTNKQPKARAADRLDQGDFGILMHYDSNTDLSMSSPPAGG
jgi:hypothetical protein